MALTAAPTATGHSGPETESPRLPDNSALGWSPWIWPAAAITTVAIADAIVGTPGAIAGFGLFLTAACLVIGRSLKRADALLTSLLAFTVGGGAILISLTMKHSPDTTGPVDLRGKNPTAQMIRKLDLRGAQLGGARLAGIDLRRKSLAGASAPGVNLARARLDGVNLRGADLRGANLTDACLRGADLTGTLLNGATVDGADLGGIAIEPQEARTLVGQPTPRGIPPTQCR